MTTLTRWAAAAAFITCALAVTHAQGQNDWPTVGNDPGGMKFSTLTQITPANVTNLKKAWTYDLGPVPGGRGYGITPLVIDNVMYFPKGGSSIVALNATTGKDVWTFDLKSAPGTGGNATAGTRGISYWAGTPQTGPRVVIGTANGFIVQINAKTGQLVPGPSGVMNMATGVTEKYVTEPGADPTYAMNTPPAIYKNLAIIAGRTGESGRYGVPGDPRAFDLTTGKEVWRFHIIPYNGELNDGTWGLNGWQDRKSAGVWVPMTVDVENDMVFIPTGNATNQNFGGSRPGLNLYSTSVVALRASTGKYVWHFQHAHHDVYDWDTNSPPSLIETTKDGQRVKAVAQMTKQGLLFMFDRMTGAPIFGVEERPVPVFDAPGDAAWPTQPFPVKPTGLTRDSMRRSEISKISPEAEKYCTELFDKSVNMGAFTPYGMNPSLVFPGSEGGGGWGGVSANPSAELLFVNTRHLGVVAQLSFSSGVLPSFGKSKIPTTFYTDPNGFPCNQPPWAELVAVSTRTGDIVWRVPLGEYPELEKKGITGTGTVGVSGAPIATASGLLFIGASTDGMFRAFDQKTGKVLWKVQMPNNVQMTPLTYQGSNGKQFVAAIAGGGDERFNIPARPAANVELAAFALP